MKKTSVIVIMLGILLLMSACGTTHKKESENIRIPDGLIGQWKCEATASDGKTDTGFYEMYIKKNGKFSLYDAAAGNPGISGKIKQVTGNTMDCACTGDFDVPFCWTMKSTRVTLQYEVDGDTMKLAHNGVWMTFHRLKEAGKDGAIPKALDKLISFDLPQGFTPDMEYPFAGEEKYPMVEKGYTSEKKGYFSACILAFEGYDCTGNMRQQVDQKEYLDALARKKEITVDGETGTFGTHVSDDMPDMVAAFFVSRGDYLFEFRLSNNDEQVTDEQIEMFQQIIHSIKFKF